MTKNSLNILVTGVGAIIGYGILRQLRKINNNYVLVGADIYSDAVGQAWCDNFEQAPYTSSPDYLEWLKSIVKKHRIQLIFLGIEQDLYFLIDHIEEFKELGCEIAINNLELVKLSYDKWKVYEVLRQNGDEALIPTLLQGDFESCNEQFGLPFLLKPRSSYASKGIVKVKSKEDFINNKVQIGHNLMIQPIVGADDEEYTVAVFGDGTGAYSSLIALKRTLANDGSTAKARVIQPTVELKETLNRLCNYFKPIGPTNFQFRKDNNIWYLLEINPRISSTTSIRAAFGYDEAKMCIDFYIGKKLPRQPEIKSGYAARFIEDYVSYDGNSF